MTATAAVAPRPSWGRPFSFSWGRVWEFLVTGGLTLFLLPLSSLYRDAVGLDQSEYIISFAAFYAAYVINDPHFAVSYLLFYKNARGRLNGTEFSGAQRVRYLVAGFVVPVALVAWIAVALSLQSSQVLGSMVQLMYLLVGWHYVKQGFGVLSVLSARRGVQLLPVERKALLAHCFSGWAYAWANPAEWGANYEEAGVMYTAIAHPPLLDKITAVAFIVSTAYLAYVVVRRLLRGDRMPPLAASSGFLMSIWMWTVFSDLDPLMLYLIPGLHSLQYWYFVYLLKKNESAARAKEQLAQSAGQNDGADSDHALAGVTSFGQPGKKATVRYIAWRMGLYFATSVALAWLFFKGIPEFLDGHFVATVASMGLEGDTSPLGLGPTPYVAAFATFINVHHYFMDHVIWRRENPDTRYLRG